jgi:hypothetical protein
VHAQPEITQTELGEVVGRRLVRVEIVFGQIAPPELAALAVLADKVTQYQQQYRHQGFGEDRRHHVIAEQTQG